MADENLTDKQRQEIDAFANEGPPLPARGPKISAEARRQLERIAGVPLPNPGSVEDLSPQAKALVSAYLPLAKEEAAKAGLIVVDVNVHRGQQFREQRMQDLLRGRAGVVLDFIVAPMAEANATALVRYTTDPEGNLLDGPEWRVFPEEHPKRVPGRTRGGNAKPVPLDQVL